MDAVAFLHDREELIPMGLWRFWDGVTTPALEIPTLEFSWTDGRKAGLFFSKILIYIYWEAETPVPTGHCPAT